MTNLFVPEKYVLYIHIFIYFFYLNINKTWKIKMKFLEFLNEADQKIIDLTEPKVNHKVYDDVVKSAKKRGLENVDKAKDIIKKLGFDVEIKEQKGSEVSNTFTIYNIVSKDWQKATLNGKDVEVKIKGSYANAYNPYSGNIILLFKDKIENSKSIETEIRKVKTDSKYSPSVSSKEIDTELSFDNLVKSPNLLKKMLVLIDFEIID
jgi:flagellin-specific chaperone FliS